MIPVALAIVSLLLTFGSCDKGDQFPSQPTWPVKPSEPSDTEDPDEPGTATEPAEGATKVVAHRGGSTEAGTVAYPDNSIAALKYAMGLKCYASECDIYWTKDDKVVVAHADANCRINGLYPWEHTLEELRTAGMLANGEKLPELEDFIRTVMVEGNCTRLWLDIKNITVPSTLTQYPVNACKRACEIIKEMNAKNFCEFICTGNATVMAASYQYARAADVNIGWMGNYAASTYMQKGYSWANLSLDYMTSGGGVRTVDDFVKNGIELSVYNVDTDADITYYMSRLSDLKAVCTNYPKKLTALMQQ